jgi:hypothetical protein
MPKAQIQTLRSVSRALAAAQPPRSGSARRPTGRAARVPTPATGVAPAARPPTPRVAAATTRPWRLAVLLSVAVVLGIAALVVVR